MAFLIPNGNSQGPYRHFLFNLVIEWVIGHTTEDQPRGIRWTLFDMLEDLDFTNDLAPLSHTHLHM